MELSTEKLELFLENVNDHITKGESMDKSLFDKLNRDFDLEARTVYGAYPDLANTWQKSDYGKVLAFYSTYALRLFKADILYLIQFIRSKNPIKHFDLNISKEGLFLKGQQFDALYKIGNILSEARQSILIIDNYVDDKLLALLSSKRDLVECQIITVQNNLPRNFQVYFEAFNTQYKNLKIKYTTEFHDRFVIIDNTDFYHFGASLKDAGKKGFMFSKIEEKAVTDLLLKRCNEIS